MKFVDGLGASRVATSLFLNRETKIECRLATVEDENILLEWANDELVRNNSFNQKRLVLLRKAHTKRLSERENAVIFVIETAQDKIPLGQIRFERMVSG